MEGGWEEGERGRVDVLGGGREGPKSSSEEEGEGEEGGFSDEGAGGAAGPMVRRRFLLGEGEQGGDWGCGWVVGGRGEVSEAACSPSSSSSSSWERLRFMRWGGSWGPVVVMLGGSGMLLLASTVRVLMGQQGLAQSELS